MTRSDAPHRRAGDVTQLLHRASEGDRRSADALFAAVYGEIKRMAAKEMRHEAPGRTLQTTALVHEVWLRLMGGQEAVRFETRGHFFVAAADAIRRILVDAARARKRLKRGGHLQRRELPADFETSLPPDDDLLSLDTVLDRFAQMAPEKAALVKLRYFADMSNAEACHLLGISPATGERHWAFARAWLKARMTSA